MIYITGDTHRDFSRLYNLNENEKLIIEKLLQFLNGI